MAVDANLTADFKRIELSKNVIKMHVINWLSLLLRDSRSIERKSNARTKWRMIRDNKS